MWTALTVAFGATAAVGFLLGDAVRTRGSTPKPSLVAPC
jgi:hypothetical protein